MNTSQQVTDEDRIDLIMKEFPFEKVHAYMTLTQWKWADTPEPSVPDMIRLISTARMLLYQVIEGKKSPVGTGGFYVYRFEFGLKLTFEPFKAEDYRTIKYI